MLQTHTISVLLCDTYEVVRKGLSVVLSTQPRISVVGEAADVTDAIRLATRLQPSVVVMGLTGAFAGASEAVGLIRRDTDAKCLAFSQDEDWSSAAQWLAAGGSGYIPRRASAVEVIRGVLSLAEGKVYISPLVKHQEGQPSTIPTADLSPREQEVARLVAMGHTSAEISERLFISRRTVENHRDRIRRKLGIRNRAELVVYVVATGLLER